MKKTYELAGQVMGFFDAFKGSRPAIDNERILIVEADPEKFCRSMNLTQSSQKSVKFWAELNWMPHLKKFQKFLKLETKISKEAKMLQAMSTARDS